MRLHSTTTRSLLIGAGLAGLAVPGVVGWGAAGHEIVATIAQIYTQPDALERVCRILNAHTDADPLSSIDDEFPMTMVHGSASTNTMWPCHLASVATWADRYKYRMRWSGPLHYINAVGDHPADTCLFPGRDGWAGKPGINVFGGIHNTSNILLDWADGEHKDIGLAQEALKFIIHFLGDMHMPLHLVGRDRGGNGVDVCWEGRRSNFHSVWDNFIVARAIRQTGYNYSRPLPGGFERVERNLRGAIYDPFIRRILWEGVEGRWGEDLEGWLECPGIGEGAEGGGGANGVLRTLGDFFFPGWFASWGATDTEVICPYHWAKPIHALNCELIWPKEIDDGNAVRYPARRPRCKRFPHMDGIEGEEEVDAEDVSGEPPYELDNPDYMDPIEERMLLEQFLAQGGVRLAGVLNYIFGDGPIVDVL